MKIRRLLAFVCAAGFAWDLSGATFTVNNTSDSGPGSLRQAVADANATPGQDTVQFSILPAGAQTIGLSAEGLSITAPLIIDGTTQPGFGGKPLITLTGIDGAEFGLGIATSNCTVRALVISNFAGNGIVLNGVARNNVIGGTNGGAGNIIIANGQAGITVLGGTNNAIRGNSIFGNGGLGIDLAGDGVTANDNRDPDPGPNQLQNFPVLSSVAISSNSVTLAGSLNSRTSIVFQIDFYASPASDESGSGEGQTYLGTRSITNSTGGSVSFTYTLPVAVNARFITATATDPFGNTSEFSPSLRATSSIPPLVFSVVNTNDGGPGSLRQAILDSNARIASGPNTISFSIPASGVRSIRPGSPLPAVFEPAVIDGYTQPGTGANTLSNGFNAQLLVQLDGSDAGSAATGLTLMGDGSIVRGLSVIGFQGPALQVLGARTNVIQGNLIGIGVDGVPLGNGLPMDDHPLGPGILMVNATGSMIGGPTAAQRNVISANAEAALRITGPLSVSIQVLGNFIGTDTAGLVGYGNGDWGVAMDGASGSVIGGSGAGAGNLIAWNGNGVMISGGVSNRVQGNLIGSDITGTNALGNGSGIFVFDSSFNLIGGTNAAARNIVVANGQGGLSVSGASSSNVIQGNFIGTDAAGQRELGNGAFGIHLDTGDGNQIGGVDPGAGNIIAFNGGNGVEIGDGLGNAILRNSIVNNGGLGIDLGGDGVTANDSGDSDTGANGLQNFPELASAVIYTNRTIIRGTLRSRPGTYAIQLFENATCDDSGSGEGQILLTNLTATVPAGGLVNLNYTNAALFQAGRFITATATDVSNNTSEFSACMKLVSFSTVDLAVTQRDSLDPVELLSNVTYTITVTNRGPTNATGVVLTNRLPSSLSFVSATTSQGSCSHAAGVVTCQLNAINQGASATVSVKVLATAPGPVENIVSVTAGQVDNTPENNTASESTLLGVAELAIRIVDSPDPALTGQLLTYSVTVTNRGPNPATGVLLTWLATPVAPDAEFFSATASQGVVNVADGSALFGTIPAHGSAVLTLKVVPLVPESFELHAAVSSVEADPEVLDNEATESTAVNAGSGVVQFESADYAVIEGGSAVEVTLIRVGGDLGTVGVSYATSNGTATAGSDFSLTTGAITFGPGETSTTISVPLLDDALSECNENFAITLFNPVGFSALVGRKRAMVKICDDELLLQGVVAGVSVKAGNSAATGDASSGTVSMSADGRGVAFASAASDLAAADGNGVSDIFVRDLTKGTTRLVSASQFGGGSGNAPSDQPALAADGRSLAFVSLASDLVTNNLAAAGNVFVRDLTTDTTTLVSVSTNTGNGGNAVSQSPAISSNGLAVAFTSYAVDLVTLPNPGANLSVFVRDLAAATTRMVSVNRFGTGAANGVSSAPRISADGRWVAFESDASDLVAADTNGASDVFVRDLTNGVALLVNIRYSNMGSGNGGSCCASLSGDGRFVAFYSEATDLVPGGSETAGNIFVRDLAMGTTRLVSRNTNGVGANGACRNPFMSAEGRYVAFASDASDLVAGDSNGQSDVFVRDLLLGTMALASVSCDGFEPGNAASDFPSLSADGQTVAFLSLANNLAPGQFSAGRWQAYRRNLTAGTTALLSMNKITTGGGNDSATSVRLSANGRTAVFGSAADDLGPDDKNGADDIFAWTQIVTCPSADVAMEQAYLPNPASEAAQIDLTLTISNRGPERATGLVVSNTLATEMAYVSANSSAGACTLNGHTVTCALGSLDPHGSATISIVVQPSGPGTFPNVASVLSDACDPIPSNNTNSAFIQVNAVSPPLLSIQNTNGNFILEWPADTAPGFVLETTTNLTPSINWIVISNAASPFVVTNTLDERARFYRLKRP